MRVLLHFQSAHSHNLKCNVILSQLIRLYRLHSDLSQAGLAMYIFIKLMGKLRALKPHTARFIWRKFLNWLRRPPNETAPPLTYSGTLSLYLPNNTYHNPFQRAITNFLYSLSESDKVYLGKLRVIERSGRSIGASLFFA